MFEGIQVDARKVMRNLLSIGTDHMSRIGTPRYVPRLLVGLLFG